MSAAFAIAAGLCSLLGPQPSAAAPPARSLKNTAPVPLLRLGRETDGPPPKRARKRGRKKHTKRPALTGLDKAAKGRALRSLAQQAKLGALTVRREYEVSLTNTSPELLLDLRGVSILREPGSSAPPVVGLKLGSFNRVNFELPLRANSTYLFDCSAEAELPVTVLLKHPAVRARSVSLPPVGGRIVFGLVTDDDIRGPLFVSLRPPKPVVDASRDMTWSRCTITETSPAATPTPGGSTTGLHR